MAAGADELRELERLVGLLEKAQAADGMGGDAIAAELARPARHTAVTSLRDAPEMEAFRQALIDGLVRGDTVNQVLRLVNQVVAQALRV